MVSTEALRIGRTRVRDKVGSIGTVAYIGCVASAKDPSEVYVGVIWDDISRGKHDGSVISKQTGEIVRHFSAPHPTCASFVRLGKVDVGIPLSPETIKARYVDFESLEVVAPDNILPHTVQTASGRNDKPVELLGELKIRSYQQVQDLEAVSLRHLGISSFAGNLDWGDYSHLTEIDLAGNLLSDWNTIAEMLTVFSSLKRLSLAGNKLGDILEGVEFRSETPIRYLNLNRTNILSVETLFRLDKLFPNIAELAIAHNPIRDLVSESRSALAQSFNAIEFLDCSSCNLGDDQIAAFASLSRLRTLSLDDNPLHHMIINDGDFQSLLHLQIAGTAISQWEDIEALNRIPNLTSVRIRNCPLLQDFGSGEARSLLIARLPYIKQLNASGITEFERRDAAKWYIFRARREIATLSSSSLSDPSTESLQLKFPHYDYWVTSFPELQPRQAPGGGGSNGMGHFLADAVVNVTIRSMSAASCTAEPLIRRFPSQLSVGRLKALCFRQFGLDIDLQTLHFKSDANALPVTMENDNETLGYYGISDGAEIFMNEVDVETRRKEAEYEALGLQERMKQQELELTDFQKRQSTENRGTTF